MATPAVLDFERLLQPISEAVPTGPELREDASVSMRYYEVKDAREAARNAERRLQMAFGDEQEMASVESPDWRPVVQNAERVLAEASKDLWIAAWLIEGLVREHGFAGLRDGFRLVREICERYWDGIHPAPDEEEGYASTVSQLAGLNGEEGDGALIAPIRAIPITAPGTHSGLSWVDYQQASDVAKISDEEAREKRVQQGAVTLEMFEQAVQESSPEFFVNLRDDAQQSLEQFGRLVAWLDENCGTDESGTDVAPPASNIRNTLQESLDLALSLARDKLALADATETDKVDDQSPGGSQLTTTGPDGEPTARAVQTRDEALEVLMRVAEYFRRSEPHSVVSFALDQVVRWGRMPLPDLLKELIGDDDSRQDLFRRIGIKKEGGDDSD